MKKFEYQHITTDQLLLNSIQEYLDYMGKNGWELVGTVFVRHSTHLYFKREKQSTRRN